MIAQSSVDLLFCPLGDRGREAQEAIETETGKISNVIETFNCTNANRSSSGQSSQKAMQLNRA